MKTSFQSKRYPARIIDISINIIKYVAKRAFTLFELEKCRNVLKRNVAPRGLLHISRNRLCAFFAFRTCLSCIVSPYRIETMIKQANRVPKKVQLQKYLSVLNQITSEIVELNFQIRTAPATITRIWLWHPIQIRLTLKFEVFFVGWVVVRFCHSVQITNKF